MTLLATEPSESLAPPSESSCCPIVELRQYALHPGQRDVLIDLLPVADRAIAIAEVKSEAEWI